jgi:hypothetical protein
VGQLTEAAPLLRTGAAHDIPVLQGGGAISSWQSRPETILPCRRQGDHAILFAGGRRIVDQGIARPGQLWVRMLIYPFSERLFRVRSKEP